MLRKKLSVFKKKFLPKKVEIEVSGAVRYIGEIKFISKGPGSWLSECKNFSIFCMLPDTDQQQWELFRTLKDKQGKLIDDMYELLECTITMGELCYGSTIEKEYGLGPGE
jgi:hypothetical protein